MARMTLSSWMTILGMGSPRLTANAARLYSIIHSRGIAPAGSARSGAAHGAPSDCCGAQVMRRRTVAETNSLTTTTQNTAISISDTSCQANWLMEA